MTNMVRKLLRELLKAARLVVEAWPAVSDVGTLTVVGIVWAPSARALGVGLFM